MKAGIVDGIWLFNSLYERMGKKMRTFESELVSSELLTKYYTCPSTCFVIVYVCARKVGHLYWKKFFTGL